MMVGDILLVMQQAAGAGKEQPAEGCGRQPRDGTEQAVFDRIADKIKKAEDSGKTGNPGDQLLTEKSNVDAVAVVGSLRAARLFLRQGSGSSGRRLRKRRKLKGGLFFRVVFFFRPFFRFGFGRRHNRF